MEFTLPESWRKRLASELSKLYFSNLHKEVDKAYRIKTIFPAHGDIFKALELCPFDKTKVVILGQDPYHGKGQAQGLSFSVPDGIKIPPSLRNVYKEIESDLGKPVPESGNLEHWAKQGVLLLNATLTVESCSPSSHQGLGWETFTDEVIQAVSKEKKYVVFLLWGKFAEAKAELIDSKKHLILTTSHPSPFSAHRGFLGCKHFSKTNAYLRSHSQKEIGW